MRFISNALAYLLGLIVSVDTFTLILISSASKSMSMELVFDFLTLILIVDIVMNRFLEIDSSAWSGLEETAGSSSAKHHVGAVSRLISCII